MRTALENQKIFSDRRQKLASSMQGSTLILAAPEETYRNSDVHNSFRQDSNLYYLTGFEEPGSVLVFRPGQTPETVLFVRKKDIERETWDGFRFGPEEAAKQFRMDKTFPIEDFEKEIPSLLKSTETLYYRSYRNRPMDAAIEKALMTVKASHGRSGFGLLPVLDSEELLSELRVIKSDSDIQTMKIACDLTSEAHIELMKYAKPGMNERELHGYFIYQIMKRGAAREGYGGILAGGANACTLHYVFNDQPVKDGELLLVDAAGEYNYYTSDITRTYPINGKFSPPQLKVYEGVLKIQKALIEVIKPGVPFQNLHEMASNMLTDLMLELGLLSGRKDDVIKANQYRKYYPHGVGHFLGMDVHDAGLYFDRKNREPRKIEAGMIFTIEPGLYIPANDASASSELRGIGVRIEDNILVTPNGYEVLTKRCPKEVEDLARTIGYNYRN
jgi:Xaa-Pro aminopeptidase